MPDRAGHDKEGRAGAKPRMHVTIFVFCAILQLYFVAMSIRKGAGEWEPLLLGIEPEYCGVCNQVLYRNTTMLKGGWERCSVCNRFVHYACLASGKISTYLKRRPRVCLNCEQK